MRYLKKYKIFEDENFNNGDMTNQYFGVNGWTRYTKGNYYKEIKNDFGISSDELGWILTEFLDEYSLIYKCRVEGEYIVIDFYPSTFKEITNDLLSGINLLDWLGSKIGHAQVWDWDMLSEMDDRLGDFGLTIKEDGIYQITLVSSQLQILILKK